MGTKSEWLGLWNTRSAVYQSKALTQKQIKELPKKCRVILRYNKFHRGNDDITPKFVFSFCDAETSEAISFGVEDYSDKLDILINGLNNIGERCRGKYLDDDNNNFLYDIYEDCMQLIREVAEI